jgi:hypothetical protein
MATNISMILASITGGGGAAPAVETGGTQTAAGAQPAAAGATGGFSTLTTAITEFKTQLDLLNISLVYTVALLGNATGISFYLTSIATYLSGTMTTTLQDFQAYLDGDFTGCMTAFNELIYLGGNSIYNSLGAIFGVLSDIYERWHLSWSEINGDLPLRSRILSNQDYSRARVEAQQEMFLFGKRCERSSYCDWNLIAAMEASTAEIITVQPLGKYKRTVEGDGGSVRAGTSYVWAVQRRGNISRLGVRLPDHPTR